MANKKHVARLKQGVEAWNQWRRENPKIRPNLSRADLIRASLRGADLRRTNLGEADLSHSCGVAMLAILQQCVFRLDAFKASLSLMNPLALSFREFCVKLTPRTADQRYNLSLRWGRTNRRSVHEWSSDTRSDSQRTGHTARWRHHNLISGHASARDLSPRDRGNCPDRTGPVVEG